jgi:hypothetical protein
MVSLEEVPMSPQRGTEPQGGKVITSELLAAAEEAASLRRM